jgi:hypothetical protein
VLTHHPGMTGAASTLAFASAEGLFRNLQIVP